MPLRAYYRTILVDEDMPESAVEVVTVPIPYVARKFLSEGELDLQRIASDFAEHFFEAVPDAFEPLVGSAQSVRGFVELISKRELVPSEQFARELIEIRLPMELSLMQGASLGDLLRFLGRKRPGAYSAFGAVFGVVVFGPTPIAIVAVPGTMILFGAAAAVSQAMEAGLKPRLEDWLKG